MRINYKDLRKACNCVHLTSSRFNAAPHGFRGNAIVILGDDGSRILMSYTTVVAEVDADGVFHKRWQGWSVSTARHIRMFAREYAPAWLSMLGVGADGKRHGSFKENWLTIPITEAHHVPRLATC